MGPQGSPWPSLLLCAAPQPGACLPDLQPLLSFTWPTLIHPESLCLPFFLQGSPPGSSKSGLGPLLEADLATVTFLITDSIKLWLRDVWEPPQMFLIQLDLRCQSRNWWVYRLKASSLLSRGLQFVWWAEDYTEHTVQWVSPVSGFLGRFCSSRITEDRQHWEVRLGKQAGGQSQSLCKWDERVWTHWSTVGDREEC